MTKESEACGGKLFSIGSVLAAFGAGLCCVGPLVFTALGLSTATSLWLLQRVVPYRNHFFLATFAFVALGLYTAYRKRQSLRILDWCLLGGSIAAVMLLIGYALSIEGF